MDSEELLIGRSALQRGWITPAQLKECLAARASGKARLSEILVSKGLLDPARLAQLRDHVASQAPTMPAPPGKSALPPDVPPGDVPPEVRAAAADPKNRLGKYVLVRELGRGAMGAVHQAWDPELRRWAAVKVLLGDVEADDLARFRREAETAAALRHPNIVRIYEVGRSGDRPYIAMDYIEGETLAGRKLPARKASEILVPVARALETAHRLGIVHRDLKPQNLMIDSRGNPCVMDFGLAKKLAQPSQVTVSGTVMGTPSYMAPEQAQGFVSKVDARSDVYALGAILYELLTGAPPFRGAGVLETLRQVVAEEPVPPRRRERSVPRDLETIVLKCLEKERARRYPSAAALADDLERFLAGRAIAARPAPAASRLARRARRNPAPFLVSAAVLLGVAALVLALLPQAPREAPVALPTPPRKPAVVAPPPPVEADRARLRAQPEFDHGQRLLDQARLDLYRPGADLSRMKSNLEESARRFSNAIATFPGFAEAHLGRGHALALLRRPDEAEKDFARAAELLPSSAAALLARGHLLLERYLDYMATADWRRDELPPGVDAWRGQALRDFQRARDLGLEGDPLLYLQASVAYAEEKPAEAVAILTRLVAAAPSKEEYVKLRGDVRLSLYSKEASPDARNRLLQEAVDDYARAIQLRANYHEAYRRRGDLLWRSGRAEEALADFQAGLRMDPSDSRALSDMGTYHQRAGRAGLAESFFDQAIAADPSNFRAWGNRAVLKMGRNEPAAARADLERSLQANPNYLTAIFNLANCREMLGEPDEAIRLLSGILSRRDEFSLGYYTRGVIHFKNGRWASALPDLEKAAARDPRSFGAKARPLIEECRRKTAGSP